MVGVERGAGVEVVAISIKSTGNGGYVASRERRHHEVGMLLQVHPAFLRALDRAREQPSADARGTGLSSWSTLTGSIDSACWAGSR